MTVDPGPGQYFAALCYVAPLVAAAACDLKEFRIPNRLVLCYAVISAVCLVGFFEPATWGNHILALAITFAVGALLFQLRLLGGGDVKLLTVVALWLGMSGLPPFMFVLCIMGGVVTVFLFLLRGTIRVGVGMLGGRAAISLPAVLRPGERIPYAVPILITAIGTSPMIFPL